VLVLGGCRGSASAPPGTGGEPVQPGGIPAALAEGSRIFFVSTRGGNPEIYTMRGDGSGATNLTDHPADDLGPVVSLDGRTIGFTSSRPERAGFVMGPTARGSPA
jgi:Tol biopolymer transport system component